MATYRFWGKVIYGRNMGKSFGFPTANLLLHQNISEGVYISKSKLGRKWYKSVSFIGKAKTFGETKVHAESHIFDFDSDIYGSWISISLLKKIRGNRKFASREELIENMKKDKEAAVEYFRKHRL